MRDLIAAVDGLEGYALKAIAASFAPHLSDLQPDRWCDAGALFSRVGYLEKYRRLFEAHLELLCQVGLITRRGTELKVEGRVLLQELSREREQLRTRFLEKHPSFAANVQLLDHCLRHHAEVLSGKTGYMEVLFEKGSLELVAQIYNGSAAATFFNDFLATSVARVVGLKLESEPGNVVNVLELGAGTGGSTGRVLEALAPFRSRVRYAYTDVSIAFVNHGKARFDGALAGMSFRSLDLEADPRRFADWRGHFDLALASNVVHATRNIDRTLAHVNWFLKPSGTVLLSEITEVSPFLTATFGLTDGWWSFEDAEFRLKNGPLLSRDGWCAALERAGFGEANGYAPARPFQSLLVGEKVRESIIHEENPGDPRLDKPRGKESDAKMPSAVPTTRETTLARLRTLVAGLLLADEGDIDSDQSFADYGVDSLLGVKLVEVINQEFGLALEVTAVYSYSNLRAFAEHLDGIRAEERVTAGRAPEPRTPTGGAVATVDLAIVGLSGRFAGARTADAFFRNLLEGKCSVSGCSTRWDMAAARAYYPNNPGPIGSAGFLDDVDAFDPLFFEIAPLEARHMDPQQRLFLQEVWRALEDAGYAREDVEGTNCGVFVGAGVSDYGVAEPDALSPTSLTGNAGSVLAARISYFLNLRGPSVAIDTACSSSLTALCMACDYLRAGRIDAALVGGVSLLLTPRFHALAGLTGMLSPDGVCRPFDDGANGFVPGEAAAAVYLKRLDDARRDRDHVYAVIKGNGFNQDGRSNGITAPNPAAQRELIVDVYDRFGIDPGSITYVETHGTGTELGDPIEMQALTAAFRKYTDRRQFCGVSSVKGNIGHTLQAAGIASLIKVALAFERESIPPAAHFREGNRRIDFADSPFYVVSEARRWPRAFERRRAAISSFGMSGTNCHVVLEESEKTESHEEAPAHVGLLAFSARDEARLDARVAEFRDWLAAHRGAVDLRDVAFTLHCGRTHFEHRAVVFFEDEADLIAKLRAGAIDRSPPGRNGEVEFASLEDVIAGLQRPARSAKEHERLWRELGRRYLAGATIPWRRLGCLVAGRRVSLPTYPFEKQRFWIEPAPWLRGAAADGQTPASRADGVVHLRRFSRRDSFVEEHVLHGRHIVPGVALLELVRAAVEREHGLVDLAWEAVKWTSPVVVDSAYEATTVELTREARGIRFAVVSTVGGARVVNAEGYVAPDPRPAEPRRHDLSALRRGTTGSMEKSEIYLRFRAGGASFGRRFQCVEEIRWAPGYALARVQAEQADAGAYSPFQLDAAFHSLLGVIRDSNEEQLSVPVGFERMVLHRPLPARFCLYARAIEDRGHTRLELHFIDESGQELGAITGVEVRAFAPSVRAAPEGKPSSQQIRLLRTSWVDAVDRRERPPLSGASVLVYAESPATLHAAQSWFQRQHPKARFVAVGPGEKFSVRDNGTFTIRPTSPEDAASLFERLALSGEIPAHVIWVADSGRSHDLRREIVNVQGAEADSVVRLHNIVQQLSRHGGRRRRILCVFDVVAVDSVFAQMLDGYARTLRLENPSLSVSTVGVSGAPEDWLRAVVDELSANDVEVRLSETVPKVSRRAATVFGAGPLSHSTLKAGGHYLITGGAGGIGCVLAAYLSTRYDARLVLAGRSHPDEVRERLVAAGLDPSSYVQCDVTDREQVEALYFECKDRYRTLDGIFHLAGITSDDFATRKSEADLRAVIAPKVKGLLNLDDVTRHENLDFFCAFSSLSAFYGNVGQGDYAAANSFLNAFAHHRNHLKSQRRRHGRMLSIAWPLWATGMQIGAGFYERMIEKTGMTALEPAEAMAVLEEALTGDEAVLGVFKGDWARFEALGFSAVNSDGTEIPVANEPLSRAALEQAATAWIAARFAETIGIPPGQVDPDGGFERYGLTSLVVIALTDAFEKDFGPLSKTLFFEHFNLREVARYFVANHEAALRRKVTPAVEPREVRKALAQPSDRQPVLASAKPIDEPIAIVGMSGAFAGAENLDVFWTRLQKGEDFVHASIPEPWRTSSLQRANSSQKGGFVSDHAAFDPLFFRISPKEAELMDPQERHFLMHAWKAIEEAGYSEESLKWIDDREGKVGVFAGVMWGSYSLYGLEAALAGDATLPFSAYYAVANRVSSSLNFSGPSVVFDTACSSSLTAIHYACQSLRLGECQVALAGGVNLSLHPLNHMVLSARGFLSREGRCATFGAAADGYVPGEGTGVLVLKTLSAARASGDHIHGLIRATALNHGGRTSGFTVPNPVRQGELISDVLAMSGADPRSIGYIEAHGTGTSLGDPIEINGLERAFARAGLPQQSCPIGSLKSNLGHLEAASGVAGLMKVLLQMKHRTLVPSIHAEATNPRIDFGRSPFFVQKAAGPWRNFVDERGASHPLRAGLSSFGAGGSNAHLIIEEAPEEAPTDGPDRTPAVPTQRGEVAWILSADGREQLEEKVRDLHRCLKGEAIDPYAVGFVLQTGRRHLSERTAFVGAAAGELLGQMEEFLAGRPPSFPRPSEAEAIAAALADARRTRDFRVLAEAWLAGADVNWGELYEGERTRHVSLPVHRFKLKNHWFRRPLPPAAPSDERRRLFRKEWVLAPASAGSAASEGRTLYLLDKEAHAEVERFLADEDACFVLGSEDRPLGRERFELNSRNLDSAYLERCLAGIGEIRALVDCVHLGKRADSPVDVEMGLAELQVFQTVIRRHRARPLALFYLVRHVQRIRPELEPAPRPIAGAMLIGTVKAIAAEYRSVDGRVIDVGEAGWREAIALARHELTLAEVHTEVSYRGGLRYAARFAKLDRQAAMSERAGLTVDSEKVYLVTGGTSGIGLALAEHLIARGARRLVLMGRSSLPTVEHWDEVLRSSPKANVDAKRRAGVARLAGHRSAGVQFLVSHASLVDRPALEDLLHSVTERWGALGGVFHCAGIANYDEPAFINKSMAQVRKVFEPKVSGLVLLDELVGLYRPDFFVLFSSSAVIPALGVGAAEYAGANEFMDYFAQHRQGASSTRYKAIDWTSWSESGTGAIKGGPYYRFGFEAFDNVVGFALLDDALAVDETCVFAARMTELPIDPEHWLKRDLLRTSAPAAAATADDRVLGAVPKANRSGSWDDDVLRGLAGVLRATLNLSDDEVLPDKRFSDYGVDSILLAEMVTRIEAAVGESVDPTVILANDTLRKLATHIAANYPASDWKSGDGSSQAEDSAGASVNDASGPAKGGKESGGSEASDIGDRVERYALALLQDSLWQIQPRDGRRNSLSWREIVASVVDQERWTPLLRAMKSILERAGIGERVGDDLHLPVPSATPGELDQARASLLRDARSLAPHLELITRCIRAYPDIFGARRDPVSVLFPQGGVSEMRKIYTTDPQLGEINRLIAADIAEMMAALPPDQHIRILEIGAGTGSTSEPILRALSGLGRPVDYHFTDVSPAFLKTTGRALQTEFSFVQCSLFDVEKAPSLQGIAPHAFDVVVAANVLHATPRLGRTVANVARLLKPGGTLCLLEMVEANPLSTFTFGLLEGWWKFADRDQRLADSPLASIDGWRGVLGEAGFSGVRVLPAEGNRRSGYFDYRYLKAECGRAEPRTAVSSAVAGAERYAVVGMACKLASAENLEAFWRALADGRSLISEVPRSRWDSRTLYSATPAPGKTASKWGGFMQEIELFDDAYFRMSPALATELDPASRLVLERCAEVLRDSGYEPRELSNRRVGVFIGARKSSYAPTTFSAHSIVGLGQNMIAAHVAHHFNLKGPAIVIDTACSSSLVSIHMAIQSLRAGEVDCALAGGVDLLLDETPYLLLTEAGVISRSDRSYAFDRRAAGFVPGEGAGVVMIKRLSDAIREGDRIYSVVAGSAVNNDGSTMGITTPSHTAQADVIKAALTMAGVRGEEIGHVETHGTGTQIGDPIELSALKSAFSADDRTGFCGLSTVKTNIGHLLCAAGVASFIKVALCLHHKCWVPTLNADEPNPRFDFERSPFYLQRARQPWDPERDDLQRAGVSSFGFGGTNAHFVLEEYRPERFPEHRAVRRPLGPIAWNKRRLWVDRQGKAALPPAEREGLEDFLTIRVVEGEAASGQEQAL